MIFKNFLIKLLDKLTGNRLAEAERLKENEMRRALLLLQSHVDFTVWLEDKFKQDLLDTLFVNNEELLEFLKNKNISYKVFFETIEPKLDEVCKNVTEQNQLYLKKTVSPFTYEIKEFLSQVETPS